MFKNFSIDIHLKNSTIEPGKLSKKKKFEPGKLTKKKHQPRHYKAAINAHNVISKNLNHTKRF